MSNKTQLQENNADLQTIKSTIEDLPLADDVKNGKYVWMRVDPPYVMNPEITADDTVENAMHFTSDDVDLTQIEESFFDGFSHSSGDYYFTYEDGNLMYFRNGMAVSVTWDSAQQAIIGTTGGGVFSYDGAKNSTGELPSYIVDDNKNAYPDDGEQNGYYYKKDIQKASGTVTLASQSKNISFYHGLTGKKVAYILTKNDEITVGAYDYVSAAYPIRERVSTAEKKGTYTGTAVLDYMGKGSVHSPGVSHNFTQNNENKTVTITFSSNINFVFQSGTYIWYAMKM